MKPWNLKLLWKIVLLHLLLWLGIYGLATFRNSGNYRGNLAITSFYFVMLCVPVFYLIWRLVLYGFSPQMRLLRFVGQMLALYLFSLLYAYVFIYFIFPTQGVFFYNPKGIFTLGAYIGSITVQFLLLWVIALLTILIQRYWRVLLSFLELKKVHKHSEANRLHYMINMHLESDLLTYVADVEAAQGNWDNYELICKIGEIKSYARRIQDSNQLMVPLEEEWNIVCTILDVIRLKEGRDDLFDVQVTGEWSGQLIPACTLLTLVEDIAQHACFEENNSVSIHLQLAPEGVSYSSKNTANKKRKPVQDKRYKKGMGLILLKKQLDMLLPGQYEYHATLVDDLYSVYLKISYHEQPNERIENLAG